MDFKEVWNEFCFHVHKNLCSVEKEFQTTVEFLFGKLGWSEYKGDIVSQLEVPVGSSNKLKPDIVLNYEGSRVIVIELKRASVSLSEDSFKQLSSYMRQLRLDYGILIGDSLQLYYDLPNSSDPIKVFDVQFRKDSIPGAECMSVLQKDDFSLSKLKDFCEKCLASKDVYVLEKKVHNVRAFSTKPSGSNRASGKMLPGWENKRRPKRTLTYLPEEFTKTHEVVTVIAWNEWSRPRQLWKREGYNYRFFIGAENTNPEIFVVIGIDDEGRYMVDRWYEAGETNPQIIMEFDD